MNNFLAGIFCNEKQSEEERERERGKEPQKGRSNCLMQLVSTERIKNLLKVENVEEKNNRFLTESQFFESWLELRLIKSLS